MIPGECQVWMILERDTNMGNIHHSRFRFKCNYTLNDSVTKEELFQSEPFLIFVVNV